MHANRMRTFWNLYKKELYELRGETIIILAAPLALWLWMYFQGSFRGSTEYLRTMFMAPLSLLAFLSVIIPLIASFKIISQEFAHNTIYLLMSSPLSGSMVLGAKLTAIVSQFLLGAGIGLVSLFLILWPDLSKSGLIILPDGAGTVFFALALLGFAFLLFLFCSSFFGQMVARLFRKFHGIVSLIVFILAIRLASGLAAPGNELLLNIHSGAFNWGSPAFIALYTPSLVFLLAAILLFVSAVLIYDKKMEL